MMKDKFEDISDVLLLRGGRVVATSLDVAKFFNVEHSNIVSQILRLMEDEEKLDGVKIYESFYIDSLKSKQPYFVMSSTSKEKLVSFLKGAFGKKQNKTECFYQNRLARLYNGKTRVKTPVGYIDILTDDTIIEVKRFDVLLSYLGRLMGFGYYYPNHKKVFATYGYEDAKDVEEVVKMLGFYNIEVWFLETHQEVIIKNRENSVLFTKGNLLDN
jgi:phage regulator Rha-like protein